MPEQDINPGGEKSPVCEPKPDPGVPSPMTLEGIVDFTGELEHLNELVVLHLEKCGGFTTPESYFSIVQPVLDLLEVELRVRCNSGMTRQQVKLIVQDWIDEEIALLRRGTGKSG